MAHRNDLIPSGVVAVTPSDSTMLNLIGFRVGTTAGAVAVLDALGVTTTIPNVQIGETIMGQFVKIMSTNTTAVGITGFVA